MINKKENIKNFVKSFLSEISAAEIRPVSSKRQIENPLDDVKRYLHHMLVASSKIEGMDRETIFEIRKHMNHIIEILKEKQQIGIRRPSPGDVHQKYASKAFKRSQKLQQTPGFQSDETAIIRDK